MLSTFSDPILPVFAILALGVVAGYRGWFDVDFARNLNRFTYYVAQPALVYFVVARAPGGATWSVVAIKTLAHPILLISMFAMTEVDVDKAEIALLVAAGPCGAMPFVIALQYGIKTDTIARAILISTGITLFTLAWLTA